MIASHTYRARRSITKSKSKNRVGNLSRVFISIIILLLTLRFTIKKEPLKRETSEIGWNATLDRNTHLLQSTVLSRRAASTNQENVAESNSTLSFFVMGDTPYSSRDKNILRRQIEQISTQGASFIVHVGDLMRRGKCKVLSYREASDILFNPNLSLPPTIVLPGDNDWVDCPNSKIAYNRFKRFFVKKNNSTLNLGTAMQFQRQQEREENFVLWNGNQKVLFLGLNMLGIKRDKLWRRRYEENTRWFKAQTRNYRNKPIKLIVIFAHNARAKSVYRMLQKFARTSGIPMLYIHGNGHKFKVMDKRKKNNFVRLQVDRGGIARPLLVRITEDPSISQKGDYQFFSQLVQVNR